VGSLARRLTALEEIAEAARLRPYRLLAAELGMPVEELMNEAEQFERLVDRLRAAGKTERQIIEAVAAAAGADPDKLEQEARALADTW